MSMKVKKAKQQRTTIGWSFGEHGTPDAIGLFIFEHSVTIEDVEEAARNAILCFVNSEEGVKLAEQNNGDFNWGDAATEMDEKDWAKFGLKLIDTITADVVVEHDENFYEED